MLNNRNILCKMKTACFYLNYQRLVHFGANNLRLCCADSDSISSHVVTHVGTLELSFYRVTSKQPRRIRVKFKEAIVLYYLKNLAKRLFRDFWGARITGDLNSADYFIKGSLTSKVTKKKCGTECQQKHNASHLKFSRHEMFVTFIILVTFLRLCFRDFKKIANLTYTS